MSLVESFKEKIKKIEADTGYKYKIHYKGYEDALLTNRLLVYWHKPGTVLCDISRDGKTISFEIGGSLKAELINTQGESLANYKDCITPSDDVNNDTDLEAALSMSEEICIEAEELTNILVRVNGEEIEVLDKSIARAIFDTSFINDLLDKADKPVKEKKTKAEEKTTKEKAEEVKKTEKAEEVKEVKKETSKTAIKDSGNRTEFESGAVRDIQEGKGRCDLLPLDIVGKFMDVSIKEGNILDEISRFQENGDETYLLNAAKLFAQAEFDSTETAILEYAKHMEEGCNKYGERNWQKGIPLERYVDSGIRHYLKHKRGDSDEPHDRAFIWNMLCGAWTSVHCKELNGYK